MTIRVTDYIDVQGRLRCHYGPPQMAYAKIGQLIGRRVVSAEKYEMVGGSRTWSQVKKEYDIDIPKIEAGE